MPDLLDDVIEQTLFVAREVDLYRIPPRTGRGHLSGEWRRDDKIATQRCRVMAVGSRLEVRLDDPNSGEIFGVCPITCGQRDASVEGAVDSSRNFALRLVDPATSRHAFIGMSFAERATAFDFNVSISEFERKQQRKVELEKSNASKVEAPTVAGAAAPLPSSDVALLYNHEDLRLKEGENIKISLKSNPSNSSKSGGFLSRLKTSTTPSEDSLEQERILTAFPRQSGQSLPSDNAMLQAFDAQNFKTTSTMDAKSSEAQGREAAKLASSKGAKENGPEEVARSPAEWATF